MDLLSDSSARRPIRAAAPRLVPTGLLCLGIATPCLAIDKSWNAANGNWGTAGNWSPIGVPGPADTARIGNLPGISNGIVTLNIDDLVVGLQISDGMTLRTSTHDLSAATTTVSGQNADGPDVFPSTLRVQQGAAFYDFVTDDLTVADEARVLLENGSRIRVDQTATLESGGILGGRGFVEFFKNGASQLVNDGQVLATAGGLVLHSQGTGRFNLDGGEGAGVVTVDTQDGSDLVVADDALTDEFSGTIHITSNSRLNMQLGDGWTADAVSSITIEGIIDQNKLPPARISGGEVTLAGDVDVGGFSGHLLVDAPAVLQPSVEAIIGFGDRAQFTGATTINGGWFFLNEGAELDFDGATTIHGGTFTTFGVEDADGDVDFNGPTTWDGEVTINGRAQQNGDATVDSPTVINATLFDLDGEAGGMEWNISDSLIINTEETKTSGLDFFSGVMNIGGGLTARLTVNLTGAKQSAWSTLYGVVNLSGQADPFFVNRISGSTVLGSGEWNISNSNVEIKADMIMMPDAVFNFAAPGSDLRMRGETTIREGVTFTGQGTLHNGVGGTMKLYHQLSLGEVGLVNQGELTFWRYNDPDLAVLASVDRFTNDTKGTLRFRIGGDGLGEGYDHLLVTDGPAVLDGQIAVEMLNTGYAPQVGEEFTILTAAGGVSGEFVNSPVSTQGPFTYHWSVRYDPNSVVLRLEAIEGCNADLVETFGVLDLFDFLAFVNLFNAGDPVADRDGNGVLDLFDFLMYVNEFNAGC